MSDYINIMHSILSNTSPIIALYHVIDKTITVYSFKSLISSYVQNVNFLCENCALSNKVYLLYMLALCLMVLPFYIMLKIMLA